MIEDLEIEDQENGACHTLVFRVRGGKWGYTILTVDCFRNDIRTRERGWVTMDEMGLPNVDPLQDPRPDLAAKIAAALGVKAVKFTANDGWIVESTCTASR